MGNNSDHDSLDRRGFLKLTVITGSGLVVSSLAGVGLTGCAAPAAGGIAAAAGGGEAAAGAATDFVEGLAADIALKFALPKIGDAFSWLTGRGQPTTTRANPQTSQLVPYVATGDVYVDPSLVNYTYKGEPDASLQLSPVVVLSTPIDNGLIHLLPRAAQALSRTWQALVDGGMTAADANAYLVPLQGGQDTGGPDPDGTRTTSYSAANGLVEIIHQVDAAGAREIVSIYELGESATQSYPLPSADATALDT